MNQVENTLNIDTPENVSFGYEIAGIGSRFLAALIDTTIITVLQFLCGLLAILVLSQSGIRGSSLAFMDSLGAWVIAIAGLIAMLFYWGYYIFFEMVWNGRSPGKRAIHLRVIRVDGTPITITESVVRNLVRIIDFMPAYYGIGVIVTFINPQTRRLGDLAAGTVVVRDVNQKTQFKNLAALEGQFRKPAVSIPDAAGPSALPGPMTAEPARNVYPVELLSYQDVQMIEIYFQRRSGLTNRAALAGQLAANLWAKMNMPGTPPVGEAAEGELEKMLSEYRGAFAR